MANEGIKLYNKVAFAVPSPELKTDERLITGFNLEVATFGYTLGPDLMIALRKLGDTAFRAERDRLNAALSEMKGADKTYTRLFAKFPYSVPDQHEYMEKRVLGNLASQMDIRLGGNTLTPLSCGHVIDSALFDVADFGACPICQFQVPELSTPDLAHFDFKSVTPLTVLDYSPNSYATETSALISRNSSLSEDEKALVRFTMASGERVAWPTGEIFKETLPFVFAIFGADAVKGSLSGATDIMRIAYFVSDEKADLSLKENVRFKLSSSHKRGLMVLLEGLPNLAEDMMRNRERWLRLGERLKPGIAKNAKRFPKVAAAFDRLRNNPKGIVTFNKQMEESMRHGAIDIDFINLMKERPGEYARKLDKMLREATDARLVVAGFKVVVDKLPEKLLLELRKYFGSRDILDKRMFFPKGQANKVQIVEDKRKPIPDASAIKIIEVIDADLRRRYAELEPLGKVWIDPALKDVLLPFNRRGDSSTVGEAVSKGSRYPFNGDVVRGFVWWKNGAEGRYGSNRTDVDLSMVLFDENMKQSGHIAFTNLHGAGMAHSGDIQDAPNGASEFIDFDVNVVRKTGARYLALSVISYTGQTFDTFPCFAGFMERDKLKSGKVYEPESVRLKFDIASKSTSHMPVIFDLVERKVIYADMSSSGGRYVAVAAQSSKNEAMTQGMLSLPQRKPTVYDVVLLNAQARGTIVE
ncbi:MAG: hypothetical protein DI537_42815, partial [Stutzerimonas stutzeri]